MYGFQKLTRKGNADRGAYFHELFLRGRPGLCRGIMRLKHKSLIDPSNEPNLYLFPAMPKKPVGNGNVTKHFPRSVHYGISPNTSEHITAIPDIPSIVRGLQNNDATDHYRLSPNTCRNTNAVCSTNNNDGCGNFSSKTVSGTIVQSKQSVDLAKSPLLERIKQKHKELRKPDSFCHPSENFGKTYLSQENNFVHCVPNATHLEPAAPSSYLITRVGNF